MSGANFKDVTITRLAICGVINLCSTVVLLVWSNSCNSMALTAFAYLTIFDMFSLATCLVSVWVKSQKPSQTYSFGYQRFEVLCVFSSTILAQLGSLFILKESVERLIQQPEVHESRLLPGTALAYAVHMLITYSVENQALSHVVLASSSSWLQEHVSDLSESVCSCLPGLSKLLLPRLNPFALIGSASAVALIVTYFLIELRNFYAADTWAAVWIAVMIIGTLSPMSAYSGKILLQTTPSHMISQLDKCIREASTLDGVLEFRQEHFWTISFSIMCGSVHVRIRRDADEQMVLAHVFNRLSNVVTVLTVHVFKDDWQRPTSYQLINDNSLLDRSFTTGATAIANSNPTPIASPVDASYQTNQFLQKQPYRPSIPHVAAAQNAYVNLPSNNSLQNGTNLTGFKAQNLNPDIMNLLGTANPSTGSGTVKLDMFSSPAHAVSNQQHFTRTDPDGSSKSH